MNCHHTVLGVWPPTREEERARWRSRSAMKATADSARGSESRQGRRRRRRRW